MLTLPLAECGCKLVTVEGNGNTGQMVDECPTHALAHGMFAVLDGIYREGWNGNYKFIVELLVERIRKQAVPPMPLMEQSVKLVPR